MPSSYAPPTCIRAAALPGTAGMAGKGNDVSPSCIPFMSGPCQIARVKVGRSLGSLRRAAMADESSLVRAAASLRAMLLVWGLVQDVVCEVPYTDVDYFVFTDAAR